VDDEEHATLPTEKQKTRSFGDGMGRMVVVLLCCVCLVLWWRLGCPAHIANATNETKVCLD